ncbi:MAG: hypothetical protein JKY11_06320 [Alphaproteobacteria bacterium]|nr:hypothetical protein [Alphaproteobacteria bacterium]
MAAHRRVWRLVTGHMCEEDTSRVEDTTDESTLEKEKADLNAKFEDGPV